MQPFKFHANTDPLEQIADYLGQEHRSGRRRFSRLLILLSGTIISVFLTLSKSASMLDASHLPASPQNNTAFSAIGLALLLQLVSLGAGLVFHHLETRVPGSLYRQLKKNIVTMGPTHAQEQSLAPSTFLQASQTIAYTSQQIFFGCSYLCLLVQISL